MFWLLTWLIIVLLKCCCILYSYYKVDNVSNCFSNLQLTIEVNKYNCVIAPWGHNIIVCIFVIVCECVSVCSKEIQYSLVMCQQQGFLGAGPGMMSLLARPRSHGCCDNVSLTHTYSACMSVCRVYHQSLVPAVCQSHFMLWSSEEKPMKRWPYPPLPFTPLISECG